MSLAKTAKTRRVLRWLAIGLTTVIATTLLVATCGIGRRTSAPPAGLIGKLVFVSLDGFWTFDLGNGTTTKLVSFPDDTFATAPSVSPDGKLIAFGLSHYGTSANNPGGTELDVMNTDATNQRTVISAVGAADTPAWTGDSTAIYTSRLGTNSSYQIERVLLDGSVTTVVVRNADSPTVSRDGRLAYIVTNRSTGTQSLWTAASDGSSAKPLLVAPNLVLVQTPQFSPDGRQVAFAAAPPTTAESNGPRPTVALTGWIGIGVAEADGQPFDIWTIDVDGSNMRRLTALAAHVGYPTWSPDGQWIAFTGEPGLFVVDTTGSQMRQLSQQGLPAGLTWIGD